MKSAQYGYGTRLPGQDVAAARERVTAALAAEGFGVLSEIDVGATLERKLGVDFRPYVILGACNPSLAHRALLAEPQIGLMLPCNVVVQADGDGAAVSIANPSAMFGVVDNPKLEPVMAEADEKLRRVLAALG